MPCDRCTPSRLCLNHQRAAELKAKLARDDHREALERGLMRFRNNASVPVSWPGRGFHG